MRVAVIQPAQFEVSASGHAAFHHLIAESHAAGADVVFTPTGEVGVCEGAVRLYGDACFDPVRIPSGAGTLVLVPDAESELQSEAVIEYAIGLSESVAGLVAVIEPSEVGGSAIVLLGEVLAEAGAGDRAIVADVPYPVPRPVPAAPRPPLAPILAQRIGVHGGRRTDPGYPADV